VLLLPNFEATFQKNKKITEKNIPDLDAAKGVVMGVIAAQFRHADARMIEKHYAHLPPSYFAQTFGDLSRTQPRRRTPRSSLRKRVAT
jgi:cytochrome c553